MGAELHVEPQQPPMDWEQFKTEKDPYSIAMDGYVDDAPRFEREEDGPYLNMDHHRNVDRLTTLSSCAQALRLVRMGLRRGFTDEEGQFAPDVYVNDCDQDICLAWFLLDHIELCEASPNPRINKLVNMEDTLDATAGMYPFHPEMETLQEMAWVFQSYTQFRQSGEIANKDPEAFKSVITDVGNRIMQYVTGNPESLSLDTRYNRIGGDNNWAMVEEVGSQARMGIVSDGIDAFVSVRERSDGRWDYTVGSRSLLIPFDVPGILEELDAHEEDDDIDSWGGSNTIGGSPRVAGSGLSPGEVERLINNYIQNS